MHKLALVTGAYGFIGRHAARNLHGRGYEVRGIGHGNWNRDEWREWGIAEWHVADITLDSLLTYAGEPGLIVHCAGSGSVGFSMNHPYQDYQRTVATTLAVLEFARLHTPTAGIACPSSAGVYGNVQTLPIATTDPLNPASPYGLHKKMAEDLCRSYANQFAVATSIVRLFSVYGRGLRKQLLWDACSKLLVGDSIFAGSGTESRDWLHVEDAAELLVLAASKATPECPVVNGGTGVGTSVDNILREIFLCLDRKDFPQFAGTSRAGDPQHYVADIGAARAWNWAPRRAWRQGVREYVEWFKAGAP